MRPHSECPAHVGLAGQLRLIMSVRDHEWSTEVPGYSNDSNDSGIILQGDPVVTISGWLT